MSYNRYHKNQHKYHKNQHSHYNQKADDGLDLDSLMVALVAINEMLDETVDDNENSGHNHQSHYNHHKSHGYKNNYHRHNHHHHSEQHILDSKEREFLGQLRSVRDSLGFKVVQIKKVPYANGIEKILYVTGRKPHSIETGEGHFPSFEAGTMYKGMKANYAYTPQELGLWK